MEDYRLEQSGQEVQDILNGAAMQSDLTAETERATEAEQTLQGNIDAEATRAQDAEGTLQDNIDAEEARAKAAEKQNADDIDAIEEKIPSGASLSNKLATEEYVADAVATATATFRGTYNLVSDLHLNVTATEQQIAAALSGAISTADNNDYCFIQVPTSSETPTEIKEIDRYKFNGTAWAFEYKLNNSGFTAAQWAAINSGITSGDVAKLAALPTNAQLTTLLAGLQSDIDGEETRAKAAELALQGNIDSEEARAKAAEKQNADDIDAIEAVIPESASSENKVATKSEIDSLSAAIEAILLLIPSAATSLNKLADKAYVNSSIATATATFRGTYNLVNDLGLTTSATHAQIATALAGAILTADNNDYAFVQIPTSDAMPTEIAKTERYKFNGTAWEYEYDLNNSGFTADQWAAINSGITQALVTKLMALPTNAELTTELGTLTSSITAINQKIPNAASQANKLVDTAAMESYIVQVLDVLTISYNVTSTDGHVTLSIEQVDGKITSVTLTTSDIASAAALNLKASQADLTALASRVTTAEGNITSLGGRVSTNETDIANLQQLYNDLQQSKPEPVTALPETGQQQGVIYRLAGINSYSDYMWNGSTWVLMATYSNAIDDVPTAGSDNLVKSGGVLNYINNGDSKCKKYTKKCLEGYESGILPLTLIDGYINTSGVVDDPGNLNYKHTDYIEIDISKIYLYTGSYGFSTNAPAVMFYDENHNLLDYITGPDNNRVTNMEVSFDSASRVQTKYVRFNSIQELSNPLAVKSKGFVGIYGLNEKQKENESQINNIHNFIYGYQGETLSFTLIAGFMDTSKNVTDPENQDYKHTDYIEIDINKTYLYTGTYGYNTNAPAVMFFDKNKALLDYITSQGPSEVTDMEIAFNTQQRQSAKYVVFNSVKERTNPLVIKIKSYNGIKTELSPYKEIVYAAIGDSITNGYSSTDISEGDYYIPANYPNCDAKKNYAYFIAKNFGIKKWYNYGRDGRSIAKDYGFADIAHGNTSNLITYDKMANDITHLSLWFGWNDVNGQNVSPLGVISDMTYTTWCGAWNITLMNIIKKYPFAKILVILPYGVASNYCDAAKQIAENWGVAWMDMSEVDGTMAFFDLSTNNEIDGVNVQTFRRNHLLSDLVHPTEDGYKYMYARIAEKLLNI